MKKWMTLLLCLLLMVCTTVSVGAVPEDETTTTTESGDIFISMEVKPQDDGRLQVQLMDNLGGVVSMWPVVLKVDGEELQRIDTDMSGVAYLNAVPSDATEVLVEAPDGAYAGTVFVGCSVKVDLSANQAVTTPDTTATNTTTAVTTQGDPVGTTTTSEDETKPTDASTDATQTTATETVSAQSSDLYVADTSVQSKDNLIGVGVDVDGALVGASGLGGSDWTSRSRLWMDKALYSSLVSSDSATLHLQLTHNPAGCTKEILVASKNANESLASYGDDEVKGFAFDLRMIYLDGDSRVELEAVDGLYTIEVPVPAALADCKQIAVGVCTASGIDSFLPIRPNDGMLKFSVKRFQTLALVGFGTGGAVQSIAQTPALLIIIGIGGFVLIAAGLAVLIIFALRRKKAAIIADQDNDAKDVTRKVMLAPTAEVVVGTGDGSDKEEVQSPVLLDYDEQSDLSREERRHFRAKEGDPVAIERLESESTPPAQQISPTQVDAVIPEKPQGVDDLLSELDELLDDLDDE